MIWVCQKGTFCGLAAPWMSWLALAPIIHTSNHSCADRIADLTAWHEACMRGYNKPDPIAPSCRLSVYKTRLDF